MQPFSDLDQIGALAASLAAPDAAAAATARQRQQSLTKPPGSLGRLEELAEFIAGWQGTSTPTIDRAQAIIFAGNHGVCAQGVNAFPQSVTAQMVKNFQTGGAAINQLCRQNNADLSVVAIALDRPTADFTQDAALTKTELLAAINQGIASVKPDTDILILGEMGIGNSTVAAALCAALFVSPASAWVGPGTAANDTGLTHKTDVIERGLARHAACKNNPLAILQAFGGHEQAALTGAIIAARQQRTPVLLDGFICTAAAAVLHSLAPTFLDHCLVGHISSEPGHERLLTFLNKRPILDLDMRLGEGSGAALSLTIVRAALACHNGMATFDEAGVANAGTNGT